MLIKLPNGLLDGADLFNYVEVDEIRGKQQNYLVDRNLVLGNIGHIPKILEDCVKVFQTKEGLAWKGKISDAIHKISSGDIETILVKIRENTYGTRFYHGAQCSHCGHEMSDLRLDLDKLELDVMPIEELLKPKEVELEKSKSKVLLKPLYLNDLFEAIKLSGVNSDKLVTESIKLAIKSIDGDIDNIDSKLAELPALDLDQLKEEIQSAKLEGNIDTDVEITCEKCKKDYKIKLNTMDPDFFDRTKGSTITIM